MRNVYTIICGICGGIENQQVVQQDDLSLLLDMFSRFSKRGVVCLDDVLADPLTPCFVSPSGSTA